MNILKKFKFFALLLLCAAYAAPALAQPLVTPEHIAELESRHEQAMNSLLKNDFQGAIRAYSDILLMEPDDETAYTGLGQIYLIQGHFKKAYEMFENALEINPENQVALVGIQRIMDPDGTEGMVSKLQAETETYLAEPPAEKKQRAPFATLNAPDSAPRAAMAERRSAVKAKKTNFSPVVRKTEAAPAPAFKNKQVTRGGRLGLLRAQRIQMALRKAGYYSGPVNGMLGTATKNAVRNFQQDFGIEPTGRVSPPTWERLSQYLKI